MHRSVLRSAKHCKIDLFVRKLTFQGNFSRQVWLPLTGREPQLEDNLFEVIKIEYGGFSFKYIDFPTLTTTFPQLLINQCTVLAFRTVKLFIEICWVPKESMQLNLNFLAINLLL
jgi:hypothetical protein